MRHFFVLCLLLLVPGISFAEPKTIKLGVESINYYPLYGTFDENDKDVKEYTGFSRELFDLFSKSQSDFVIVFAPDQVKRLFSEYISGNIDAKFPDNPLWASDKKGGKEIKYSDSIVKYRDGAFVLKENNNSSAAIKKLGTISGFTAFPYVAAINAGSMALEELTSPNAILKAIFDKKIDAGYFNQVVGEAKLRKNSSYQGAIEFEKRSDNPPASYFLSSFKHPELITAFNEFLRSKAGAIKDLKAKFDIQEPN